VGKRILTEFQQEITGRALKARVTMHVQKGSAITPLITQK
jgi:hypothetical protein